MNSDILKLLDEGGAREITKKLLLRIIQAERNSISAADNEYVKVDPNTGKISTDLLPGYVDDILEFYAFSNRLAEITMSSVQNASILPPSLVDELYSGNDEYSIVFDTNDTTFYARVLTTIDGKTKNTYYTSWDFESTGWDANPLTNGSHAKPVKNMMYYASETQRLYRWVPSSTSSGGEMLDITSDTLSRMFTLNATDSKLEVKAENGDEYFVNLTKYVTPATLGIVNTTFDVDIIAANNNTTNCNIIFSNKTAGSTIVSSIKDGGIDSDSNYSSLATLTDNYATTVNLNSGYDYRSVYNAFINTPFLKKTIKAHQTLNGRSGNESTIEISFRPKIVNPNVTITRADIDYANGSYVENNDKYCNGFVVKFTKSSTTAVLAGAVKDYYTLTGERSGDNIPVKNNNANVLSNNTTFVYGPQSKVVNEQTVVHLIPSKLLTLDNELIADTFGIQTILLLWFPNNWANNGYSDVISVPASNLLLNAPKTYVGFSQYDTALDVQNYISGFTPYRADCFSSKGLTHATVSNNSGEDKYLWICSPLKTDVSKLYNGATSMIGYSFQSKGKLGNWYFYVSEQTLSSSSESYNIYYRS